jgi:hypothetical protein
MTETLTLPGTYSYDLEHVQPGRVLYLEEAPRDPHDRTWLYIVSRVDGTLYGVRFENTSNVENLTRHATWETVPVPRDGSSPLTHPLTAVASWTPGLVEFFRRATTATTATTGTSSEVPADVASALEQGRREGREQANREFEEWKARAEQIAHTYADENDLCSEFDRCMEEVGLSPRGGKTFRIVVDVTLPRGSDPWSMDLEDLYNDSEGTTMVDVTRID